MNPPGQVTTPDITMVAAAATMAGERDEGLITPAMIAAAATMAGVQDQTWDERFSMALAKITDLTRGADTWDDRFYEAYMHLVLQISSPHSPAALLNRGMFSEKSKSFRATGVLSVKLEGSSQRVKIVFATPTPDDPGHTDELRTHRIDTPLGATQLRWLKRHKGVLKAGAVDLRVYINVEPAGQRSVRVLNYVQINE